MKFSRLQGLPCVTATECDRRPRAARVALALALSGLIAISGFSSGWAHDDPATDGLIDGGGNPATDCVAKFQTGLELNSPAGSPRPRELACKDGDLTCDADGEVNGSCTFNVGVCLADDEEVFECLPAGVGPGGVQIRNKPASNPKHDAGLQALQDEVDALLGSNGVACESPGAGGGNCMQCTAEQAGLTVPLNSRGGKKKIKMRAVTEPAGVRNRPIKDSDKLALRCTQCESESAFEHISRVVFKTGCASQSCHTGQNAAAGLNLDVDDIGLDALHDELFVEASTAPGAAALGMMRITAGDPNLGTLDSKSLLYEKLANSENELDEYCTNEGLPTGCLGDEMPPGIDTYSSGKLGLLKAWIEGGGGKEGWMPGATCGEPVDLWEPAEPPAPPAPDEGFQLHMPQPEGFVLAPGTEFEGCWWMEVPETVTETWYIERIEMVANEGTHHIILVEDVPDGGPPATPLPFDPDDTACLKNFGVTAFRIVSQDPTYELVMPDSVGFKVEPGQVFAFNPHYANNTNKEIYPEIWFNFYGSTTPTPVVSAFDLPGPTNFTVAPGEIGLSPVRESTNASGAGRCYYSVTTHQHRRGTGMKVWTSEPSGWNDTNDLMIYNTDWDHPDWLQPEPRLHLAPGDAWYQQCEWDNGVLNDVNRRCQLPNEGTGPNQCSVLNEYVCATNADCPAGETTGLCRDCNLNFGFLAEDEMCFLLAYYYPAQAGADPCPY